MNAISRKTASGTGAPSRVISRRLSEEIGLAAALEKDERAADLERALSRVRRAFGRVRDLDVTIAAVRHEREVIHRSALAIALVLVRSIPSDPPPNE